MRTATPFLYNEVVYIGNYFIFLTLAANIIRCQNAKSVLPLALWFSKIKAAEVGVFAREPRLENDLPAG